METKDQNISQSDVSLTYRNLLGNVTNDEYVLVRLINEHHVLKDGHLKKVIDVIIKAKKEKVSHYYWRVPLSSSKSKLTGVKVLPNPKVSSFKILDERDNLKTIDILLEDFKADQTVHLQLEYFTTFSCNVKKKGPFTYELIYPFAYKPVTETASFELRLYMPSNAKFNIDSNLPIHESFVVDKNRIIIASEEMFSTGDISGTLHVEHKSSGYIPFVSIEISFLFAILIGLAQYKENFGNWYFILLPILLFIILLSSKQFFTE
jgi:hypothetical protein